MWIPAGFVSYLRLLFGYETAVWANDYGLDSVCNSDCIHFEYGASDRTESEHLPKFNMELQTSKMDYLSQSPKVCV